MKYSFKPVAIYVKIRQDQMEILRLDTGESLTWSSKIPFSSSRMLVADFLAAEDHLKSLLGQMFGDRNFAPTLCVVIQQMERLEDGLSPVEERALADLAEHSGAVNVSVVKHDRELDYSEAVELAERLGGIRRTPILGMILIVLIGLVLYRFFVSA